MADDGIVVIDEQEEPSVDGDVPLAGTSGLQKEQTEEQVNGDGIEFGDGDGDGDGDESDGDEYNVEAIRAKRVNPKTGIVEYLIKWENYPEAANTWEPTHHVNCPDLIVKFEGKQDNKRKRRRTTVDSQTKRSKADKADSVEPTLLVEDDQDAGSSTETLSSLNGVTTNKSSKDLTTEQNATPINPKPKGFERALPIERILGSCTDDNDKIWFFVKWKGMSELELVEANEMEDKAPKEMCLWYRQRLYHTFKMDNDARPLMKAN